MSDVKRIISQGNEILVVIEDGVLYLKDTNAGGMSLTNQVGTEYLYNQLVGVLGEENLVHNKFVHIPIGSSCPFENNKTMEGTPIYYLDSEGKPSAWIDFNWETPDEEHIEKLMCLFKETR